MEAFVAVQVQESTRQVQCFEIEADRADSGMVFDRWVSEDVEFTDKFAVNTTITMPDKNVTIKARYKAKSNLGEDEQGETGNHNQNKRPSVPKTGDFTFPAVWGMAEILSISIIVITVIRKRLNKQKIHIQKKDALLLILQKVLSLHYRL